VDTTVQQQNHGKKTEVLQHTSSMGQT